MIPRMNCSAEVGVAGAWPGSGLCTSGHTLSLYPGSCCSCCSSRDQGIAPAITPRVKVTAPLLAVRAGARASLPSQQEAARLAIWPPMLIPWQHSGPWPSCRAQRSNTWASMMSMQPIRNKSDTWCREERNYRITTSLSG